MTLTRISLAAGVGVGTSSKTSLQSESAVIAFIDTIVCLVEMVVGEVDKSEVIDS